MDTIAYVDGYNLFYGRLRNTKYKWLDIFKLLNTIIEIQDPKSNLVKVKYFSAIIKQNFASHGAQSVQAQLAYHRALQHLYGDQIEIILGYHTVEKGTPPKYQKPINKNERVEIWEFEEKQTDVNLALHLYKDSLSKNYEQQVLAELCSSCTKNTIMAPYPPPLDLKYIL